MALRLGAVGDLLLAGAGDAPRRPAFGPDLLARLRACDLVFGNLECTLPGDGGRVETEPRVIATEGQVRAALGAGVGVVTLANNHTFDALEGGFHATRALLERLGVAWFGAGDSLEEAARPAILEARGVRLAFLGAVDHRSGPSRLATPGGPGVAPMDLARLAADIARLRREVDHVVVSLHWGEERLPIPSPDQVREAHSLVRAGASLILGHHPHVVQGLEVFEGVPIAYSLGNCVACEVPFSGGDRLTWSRLERTGCLLTADLDPGSVRLVAQTPTIDAGDRIEIDSSGFGDRRIRRADRALARGVTLGRYRREYFIVKTLRPALSHLRWSRLKRLRPSGIGRALKGLWQAGRAR